jgi:hypothetical protein
MLWANWNIRFLPLKRRSNQAVVSDGLLDLAFSADRTQPLKRTQVTAKCADIVDGVSEYFHETFGSDGEKIATFGLRAFRRDSIDKCFEFGIHGFTPY